MTNYHIGPHRTPWDSLRHLGTCHNNKKTFEEPSQSHTSGDNLPVAPTASDNVHLSNSSNESWDQCSTSLLTKGRIADQKVVVEWYAQGD